MAIHDLAYATRPRTFRELRWRLLLLAERDYGRLTRAGDAREDSAVSSLFGTVRSLGRAN